MPENLSDCDTRLGARLSRVPTSKLTPEMHRNSTREKLKGTIRVAKPSDEERKAAIAAADAAWWSDWWAADYSWAGLARLNPDDTPRHPWTGWSVTRGNKCVHTSEAPRGSRPATLQDYFRWDFDTKVLRNDATLRDEHKLLVPTHNQRTFHILHLPEQWQDGRWSWKRNLKHEDWGVVEREILTRLQHAMRTETIGDALGIECEIEARALLNGAQIARFPNTSDILQELHIMAPHSRWLADANFRDRVFGSATSFARACFSGGQADFVMAKFHGGSANFSNTRFCGGAARFNQAIFSGVTTNFESAHFAGGNAHFGNASLSSGMTTFYLAKFSGGDALFANASINGRAIYFTRIEFSGGNVEFRLTTFSGNTDFSQSLFSGGAANFDDAKFGYVDPEIVTSRPPRNGRCHFDSVHFGHGFSALGASFGGNTTFRSTQFESEARFGDNRPSPPRQGAQFNDFVSFRGARFRGPSDFSRTCFPESAEHRSGAFEGARFYDTLDMKGIERLPFSAFQGAVLDKGILLAPRHPDERDFRMALQETRDSVERDRSIALQGDYAPQNDADQENRGQDARYAALEKGCLVLKHAMAQISDKQREQAFHRLELIARQKRPARWSGPLKRFEKPGAKISLLSKIASSFYGTFARHGASSARPLIWLVGAGLLSSALYLPLGYWADREGDRSEPELVWLCEGCTPHPLWVPALEMAGRNTLGPLKFAVRRSLPFEDDLNRAPKARLAFSLVSAVHSLFSLVLIFLAALGLRRKFQL